MALYHGGRFDVDYRGGEESLDAFCLRRQDVYQRSFTFYFIFSVFCRKRHLRSVDAVIKILFNSIVPLPE